MRSVETLSSYCNGKLSSLTRSTSADYGFDKVIYKLLDKEPPSIEQLRQLIVVYKYYINHVKNSKNLLHEALLEKRLPLLLKDYGDFSWIRTTEHIKK